MYNIARFVEWPAVAFADGPSPVVVCVVGVDPFGVALDDALQGRTVKGRPVAIRRRTIRPRVSRCLHRVFGAEARQ